MKNKILEILSVKNILMKNEKNEGFHINYKKLVENVFLDENRLTISLFLKQIEYKKSIKDNQKEVDEFLSEIFKYSHSKYDVVIKNSDFILEFSEIYNYLFIDNETENNEKDNAIKFIKDYFLYVENFSDEDLKNSIYHSYDFNLKIKINVFENKKSIFPKVNFDFIEGENKNALMYLNALNMEKMIKKIKKIIENEEEEEKNIEKDIMVDILYDPKDLNLLAEMSKIMEDNNNADNKDFYIKKIIESPQRKLIKSKLILNKFDDLRKDCPNFKEVIDFIEEEVLINNLSSDNFKIPPILIYGEPGIGKTYFLNELYKAVFGFKSSKSFINLSTISTGYILTGISKFWSGSDIGLITSSIINSDHINPIIILDEIDKIEEEQKYGKIEDVLLNMLEEDTAEKFKDECLNVNINLKYVSFMATANSIDNMSSPLLNRFTNFKINNPIPEEKRSFVRKAFNEILKNKKIENKVLDLSPEVIDKICNIKAEGRDFKKTLNSSISKAYKRQGLTSEKLEIIEEDIIEFKSNNKGNIGFI